MPFFLQIKWGLLINFPPFTTSFGGSVSHLQQVEGKGLESFDNELFGIKYCIILYIFLTNFNFRIRPETWNHNFWITKSMEGIINYY